MQYVLFRYTTQAKHKSTSANISAIYVSVLLEPSPIVVAIIHPGVSAVTTSIPAPQITNILNAMLSQPRPGPATSTASTRRARLGPNTMEHNPNCFGALLLTAILKWNENKNWDEIRKYIWVSISWLWLTSDIRHLTSFLISFYEYSTIYASTLFSWFQFTFSFLYFSKNPFSVESCNWKSVTMQWLTSWHHQPPPSAGKVAIQLCSVMI